MRFNSLISFFISMILSYVFLPMLKDMINKSTLVCENYKNIKIPTSMGLAFIFTQIITLGILKIFLKIEDIIIIIYLIGFIFIGMLGLLDDTIGSDKYKGLKGHLGAFLKRELTTGNIKALLGGFIALFVSSCISENFPTILINGLLIALSTNFMNLFDLRPGRAGKVFILISIFMIIFNFNIKYNYILFAMLGSLLVYMKYDLNAEIMMGDTGSNALGYTLGFYAANNYNLTVKIIFIGLLAILHYISEKKSFSEIIENSRMLNYIDMIGRKI